MKKYLLIIFWSCLSVSVFGQQLHTTLDILHPAKRSLPNDVLDLIVVNNTVAQPDGFGHSTVAEGKVIGSVDIDLQKTATYLLLGTARVLDDSQMFLSVGFVPETQNKGTIFPEKNILSTEQVAQLCKDFQADAALVCNQLIVYDVLGYFLTEDYSYYAYLETYIVSNWSLQMPDGRQQLCSFSDTLYWESEASSREAAIQGLPNREAALLDMSEWVGEQFANEFLPTWETVDRYLYEDKNVGIVRGLDAFTHQRWDEAIEIWTAVYNQNQVAKKRSDKVSCAYAAANAAVAYEITDNLTLAQEWAEKAVAAFEIINTADGVQQAINLQYYMNQLKERIAER